MDKLFYPAVFHTAEEEKVVFGLLFLIFQNV